MKHEVGRFPGVCGTVVSDVNFIIYVTYNEYAAKDAADSAHLIWY